MVGHIQVIEVTDSNRIYFEALCKQEFRNENNSFCVGALFDGTACGIMYGIAENSLFQIMFMYVHPDYRRHGVASEMLRRVCMSAALTYYDISAGFLATPEDNEALNFWQSQPMFFISQVGKEYSISISEEGINNKLLNDLGGRAKGIIEFFSLPKPVRDDFYAGLIRDNNYFLDSIPEQSFEKKMCLCKYENGRIESIVFFEKEPNGDLTLLYAFNPGMAKCLLLVLAACVVRAVEINEYKGKQLHISSIRENVGNLIEKVIPTCKPTGYIYSAELYSEDLL